MKKLVTHDGPFHTDDIFTAALFSIYFEKTNTSYELIRSRNDEIIQAADIVFDVGGEYAPERNRYDHHQPGGAGGRENNIPYASIGLTWKHFGMELCNNEQEVWQEVDEKLVQTIDADDVGIELYTINPTYDTGPYLFKNAVKSFFTPWNESDNFNEQFQKVVPFARQVLENEIRLARARFQATALVEQDYEASDDKRIIVLSDGYPWKRILSEKPEPLIVIYPKKDLSSWGIQTVPLHDDGTFESRFSFPETWAGLRDQELEEVSGVIGATFCHNNQWLCGAVTKEAAIALAKAALEA